MNIIDSVHPLSMQLSDGLNFVFFHLYAFARSYDL